MESDTESRKKPRDKTDELTQEQDVIMISETGEEDKHLLQFGNFRYDPRTSSHNAIEYKIQKRQHQLNNNEILSHYRARDYKRDARLDGRIGGNQLNKLIGYLIYTLVGTVEDTSAGEVINFVTHNEITKEWTKHEKLEADDVDKYSSKSYERQIELQKLRNYEYFKQTEQAKPKKNTTKP